MRELQERRPLLTALRRRHLAHPERWLIPAVAAAVVAADQVSKTWALDNLRLQQPRHVVGTLYWNLTFNSGAAFSVGAGITPIVVAGVVVLVVWLLAFTRRASRSATAPIALGLGLIVGGALGNLADRAFRRGHGGAVVDFIQGVSWWPVFNVADSCIVVGVIVLLLAYARQRA